MSKQGIIVDEIRFVNICNTSNGEETFELSASVPEKGKELFICTISNRDDSQHDFGLTKDEWEIFKRIIDMQFKQEAEG